MLSTSVPVRKRIVLVGGGHAHVGVLRSFGMKPEPGVGITIVAKELDAPYSGMLPGYVAGHYTFDQCHIDLVRLARFADARLIHGEVCGIDRGQRQVHIAGRPPLAYDLLSIDTGITPLLDGIAGADEHAIAVKPVSTFAPRWLELLERALQPDGPRHIAVIGTGAAGLELVLAVRHRFRNEAGGHGLDPAAFSFVLIGSGPLLPTHNARARTLARSALTEAGIELIEGDAAVSVTRDRIVLASGRSIASDATLVTTKAAAPGWFRTADLELDSSGFIAVRATLQMKGDDDVFAVGDCATVLAHPREKAGVFAVRQAKPLGDNLRRRSRGEAAQAFTPQRNFLTILSLGRRTAIASRGRFAAGGDWAWAWKDRIDRRFMDGFARLPLMAVARAADEDTLMRCGGCAAKMGPLSLYRALRRVEEAGATAGSGCAPAEHDDAAVIDTGGDELLLETVDFFRAFWPEPYVLGEIAAEHAMSDIHAMGGAPQRALAIAVIPYAGPRQSEDDLVQLLAGARAAFERAGVSLSGGHTSEGLELAAGFVVTGSVRRDEILRKSGLRPGDALLLTKPLGTGVLFAGWMRGAARARHIIAALAGMRRANAGAARILRAHGARAMTDVTGFGLLGHLREMLEVSGVAARINAATCPRYPGVDELIAAGIGSTLLPDNLAFADRVGGPGATDKTLALLFDPQTSGGLLAGVPAEHAISALEALRATGEAAAVVGQVTESVDGRLLIELS